MIEQNSLDEQSGEHEPNATPGVDWKKYHGEGKTLSLKNKPDNDNQKED
jgi:hypothetical protein